MKISEKEKIFREIYSDYYPLVYNVVYNQLRTKDDTEDICHELFINFYKKFDEIESYRKWLLSAIKYTISNYYKVKKTADVDKVTLEKIEDDMNFAFENGQRDLRIVLGEAIENDSNYRNDKERLIFELVAIYKFTYAQTAKQLSLTERQVRYKYSEIVKRLIKCLQDKGINTVDDLL